MFNCLSLHPNAARTVALCQDEHGTLKKNIETMTKCEINDHNIHQASLGIGRCACARDRDGCPTGLTGYFR